MSGELLGHFPAEKRPESVEIQAVIKHVQAETVNLDKDPKEAQKRVTKGSVVLFGKDYFTGKPEVVVVSPQLSTNSPDRLAKVKNSLVGKGIRSIYSLFQTGKINEEEAEKLRFEMSLGGVGVTAKSQKKPDQNPTHRDISRLRRGDVNVNHPTATTLQVQRESRLPKGAALRRAGIVVVGELALVGCSVITPTPAPIETITDTKPAITETVVSIVGVVNTPTESATIPDISTPTAEVNIDIPWSPPSLEQVRYGVGGPTPPDIGREMAKYDGLANNQIPGATVVESSWNQGIGDDVRLVTYGRNANGDFVWLVSGNGFDEYPIRWVYDSNGDLQVATGQKYAVIPDSKDAFVVFRGKTGETGRGEKPTIVKNVITLPNGQQVFEQYWDGLVSEWKRNPNIPTVETPTPEIKQYQICSIENYVDCEIPFEDLMDGSYLRWLQTLSKPFDPDQILDLPFYKGNGLITFDMSTAPHFTGPNEGKAPLRKGVTAGYTFYGGFYHIILPVEFYDRANPDKNVWIILTTGAGKDVDVIPEVYRLLKSMNYYPISTTKPGTTSEWLNPLVLASFEKYPDMDERFSRFTSNNSGDVNDQDRRALSDPGIILGTRLFGGESFQ